jgi:hypothetical protein
LRTGYLEEYKNLRQRKQGKVCKKWHKEGLLDKYYLHDVVGTNKLQNMRGVERVTYMKIYTEFLSENLKE